MTITEFLSLPSANLLIESISPDEIEGCSLLTMAELMMYINDDNLPLVNLPKEVKDMIKNYRNTNDMVIKGRWLILMKKCCV